MMAKKNNGNWWKIKGITNCSVTGSNVCDLHRCFYSLFVYCNVVKYVVVSDVKAPLLLTVNITVKEGLTVYRIFQTVLYVPVQRKQIYTIEIDRKADRGRPFSFQRGKVIMIFIFGGRVLHTFDNERWKVLLRLRQEGLRGLLLESVWTRNASVLLCSYAERTWHRKNL